MIAVLLVSVAVRSERLAPQERVDAARAFDIVGLACREPGKVPSARLRLAVDRLREIAAEKPGAAYAVGLDMEEALVDAAAELRSCKGEAAPIVRTLTDP